MVIALVQPGNDDRLPVYLTRFFGRELELGLIAELLADPSERVVTLVGPGGVGKTRLLIEAIERQGTTPIGELMFIDGAALDQPARVLPQLVEQLNIDRVTDQSIGELLSENLAGRTLMLVLDNMEHLLAAAVDIAALVRALPGMRVVATSRAPLHISGERIISVEPLATNPGETETNALSVAGQLFLDRAARTGKLQEPSTVDFATIETVCSRLDGLPLAIELAAARLRILSLQALQAVLTNQLAVLTGGPVDVSERHRTLRAAIGWSYDLLDNDESRLLRELGVFAESFSLDGARAVCTPSAREAIDLLESLFDQALLVRIEDDPGGQPRFRMLTSIRDFALEKTRELHDEETLRVRHAAWFLQLAESLEPILTGPGQQDAVERLNRTDPNLRKAFDFMILQRDQESALRMVAALFRYWLIRVQWEEARSCFAAAFALGEPKPTHTWGAALRGAAIVAETQYDCEAALGWNLRAISIWEELGDTSWLARSRVDLGNVYSNLGRYDEARVEFEEVARLTAGSAELRTHLVALGSTAHTLLRQGMLREAERVYDDLMPRLRRLDDRWILATCLSNFGIATQRLGQFAEAKELFRESLQIRQDLGDEYSTGVTLINLAGVEEDSGLKESLSLQALEIGLRLNAPDLYAAAQIDLGMVALGRGDRSTAAAYYIDALDGYSSINDEVLQADVIGLITELIEESDPATSARLLGNAQAVQAMHGVESAGPIADRVGEITKRVRDRLGASVFQRETERGRQLTLVETRVEALHAARSGAAQLQPVRTVDQPKASLFGGLTPRELDVIRLITEGKTDRQIADELFISPKTANHHVTRILAKFECRNRAAATAMAIQHGLV